ncbi:BMC domain-containing protein [Halanaerobium congolense]|uniref:BMC domain-containing protein n=2 Tax=Bacillota TaxID=1239 RepID=UPI003B969D77
MIETRGLVPAIEAADAGVKAANVKLVGYEIVQGGLVMVAFVGDVAAVQASVSAGSAAAGKIGTVISEHVIPRPEADLRMVFKGKSVKPENDPPRPDPEGDEPGGKNDDGETVSDSQADVEQTGLILGQEDSEPGPGPSSGKEENEENESTGGQESTGDPTDLDSMTVGELRRLARKTPGIAIHGREISRANKEQLIREILRARGGKD